MWLIHLNILGYLDVKAHHQVKSAVFRKVFFFNPKMLKYVWTVLTQDAILFGEYFGVYLIKIP